MELSVIIPVYNAERHVSTAVESTLKQPEVAEIVLVEDNSPDNCLEICQKLEDEHKRVKLIRHADGKNHGAGVSRNLGIENAKCELIAFLDADDYFIDNRFTRARKILSEDPTVDGVYEAIGSEFENEEARRRFFKTHASELTTITKDLNPQELFFYLIEGGAGHIHLDGLVVKKDCLLRVGLFPKLRLHQDMVLCIKLAGISKLVPGDTKRPVGIRRLHLNNRITNPKNDFTATQYQAYRNLFDWAREENLPQKKKNLIKKRYYRLKYRFYKKEKSYPLALLYYAYYRIFLL